MNLENFMLAWLCTRQTYLEKDVLEYYDAYKPAVNFHDKHDPLVIIPWAQANTTTMRLIVYRTLVIILRHENSGNTARVL